MECIHCECDFETDKIDLVEGPRVVGRDDFILYTNCPECHGPLEITYPNDWAEVESAWLGEPGKWPRPKDAVDEPEPSP